MAGPSSGHTLKVEPQVPHLVPEAAAKLSAPGRGATQHRESTPLDAITGTLGDQLKGASAELRTSKQPAKEAVEDQEEEPEQRKSTPSLLGGSSVSSPSQSESDSSGQQSLAASTSPDGPPPSGFGLQLDELETPNFAADLSTGDEGNGQSQLQQGAPQQQGGAPEEEGQGQGQGQPELQLEGQSGDQPRQQQQLESEPEQQSEQNTATQYDRYYVAGARPKIGSITSEPQGPSESAPQTGTSSSRSPSSASSPAKDDSERTLVSANALKTVVEKTLEKKVEHLHESTPQPAAYSEPEQSDPQQEEAASGAPKVIESEQKQQQKQKEPEPEVAEYPAAVKQPKPQAPQKEPEPQVAAYPPAAKELPQAQAQPLPQPQSPKQKFPLYESPRVEALPPKCRSKLRDLMAVLDELLAMIEQMGQRALSNDSIDYTRRDLLSRKLGKIRIAAEEALMAANLAKLHLLNDTAKLAGIELIRLGNLKVALKLEPNLKKLGAKLRKLYGIYRKSCKGVGKVAASQGEA